ncbi:MAG: hypothetical protein FWE21_07195 [Defluviitaleaceae bacterium]|nr:hypothetical protein [Defluviitaleaceae bacterium]
MEVVFVVIIFYVVPASVLLYWIIKAAVRRGIIEAHREMGKHTEADKPKPDSIAKITCIGCQKGFDMDYPKCPHCGHKNPYI